MATAQPGTSASAQALDNRVFLFRLQMLIIDGGLTVLRNYVDQTLASQSLTLSKCLANDKTTIRMLKGRGIITQIQFDLLYPSNGSVSTSDLDITLIICLLRNLRCFKLNSRFQWNISPSQNDKSLEADICRLKIYRNEICHISTTTGIQYNDFITKWNEIEQILLRIDNLHPIKDFKQTINEFQNTPLDPNTEQMVKDKIANWEKIDRALGDEIKLLKEDQKAMKETINTVQTRVDEIEERLPADNETRPDPKKKRNLIQRLLKRYRYRKMKKMLKDGLIELYRTNHSEIYLSPLFEQKDTPLASFYIRPELNSIVSTQTRNDEKVPIKSLKEMFRTETKVNRELYVTADAGLGKTAFSNYLAITWCQAHCPDGNIAKNVESVDIDCMREFDFLFLVVLRDSVDSCSIDELIVGTIVSNLGLQEKPSEDFLLKILKNEKSLVILDGLDEWIHPEKKCNRSPKTIPHRNVREKCTILTTTRPWKLGVLNLNSTQQGNKVELTNLSTKSVETLTERILRRLKSYPNEDALKRDVRKFITAIYDVDNAEFTSVPLLLIYSICLWCDGVQIGKSKCDLYTNIVELLLSRTLNKHGDLQHFQGLPDSDIPECFNEHENCKKYFPLMKSLGKLAYYSLFNETRENTLVFDGSVARKYFTPDEMTFTLHTGILSESTSYTLTKKFSKVSFSHKTVQEFFAAIFTSSQSDTHKIVLEKCRNIQDILDMSKIFEFISKMNADRMCEISRDLMSVINEDEETRDYRTRTGVEDMYDPLYHIQQMFLSCLEEMPESENIQLYLQDFFIYDDNKHSEQLQRLLKQNKTNIKSLYIYASSTDSSVRDFIDLFSLTDLSHIQKLVYDGDYRKEVEINLLLFPSLQNLTLRWVKCTNDEENLRENLTRLQNLQYLDIVDFTLSHKILETFYNFISAQKSMKELKLWRLDCKEHVRRDCKRLNLDLSKHTNITYLYLWLLPRLQLNITSPSLVNVTLEFITLDKSSLLLSCDMVNIKRVKLEYIEMCAGILQKFICVLENLPQSVEVEMEYIKPETEYKLVIENIRKSTQTFQVIEDDWLERRVFVFQTIKPSKEQTRNKICCEIN